MEDQATLDHPAATVVAPPVAPLEGHRVVLRSVSSDDYDWIWRLSTHPDVSYRWRHPPGSLNPEQLGAHLWQGVLSQFIIAHKETSDPLGLVLAYQANVAHRTAYVAIILDPGLHRTGWPLEGFKMFMRYLFDGFDLRKVYAEAVDYNLAQYRGLLRQGKACEEGRLRQHVYVGGAYHDVYLLALYRRDWHDQPRPATGNGNGNGND
jgi:RimJ/RimL family protein N-acetyltransferase